MSQKLEILIDVDGVVVDFVTPVLETLHLINGNTYALDMVTEWDIVRCLGLDRDDWAECTQMIQAPGFARNLKPLPGAIEAVKLLSKDHDVYFCTADWRGSTTWVYDRNHFLTDHFGPVGKKTIHTSFKERVYGDILIEDKASTVLNWTKRWGNLAMLIDRPYNRRFRDADDNLVEVPAETNRVYNWEQILGQIESLQTKIAP